MREGGGRGLGKKVIFVLTTNKKVVFHVFLFKPLISGRMQKGHAFFWSQKITYCLVDVRRRKQTLFWGCVFNGRMRWFYDVLIDSKATF